MTGKSIQRKGRRKLHKTQDGHEDGKENPAKEPENLSQESKKRKIQETSSLKSLKDANSTAAEDITPNVSDKPADEMTLEEENKCFDKKVGMHEMIEKTGEYKTQEETSIPLLEGKGHMMPDQVKTAAKEDSQNRQVKHQQSDVDDKDTSEESTKEKQGNEDKETNNEIIGEKPLVTHECDTALPTSKESQHVTGSCPPESPTSCTSLKLVECIEKTPYVRNSLDCHKDPQGAIDQPATIPEVKSCGAANINGESTKSSLIGKENNENVHGLEATSTFKQSVTKLAEGQINTAKVKGQDDSVNVTLEDKPDRAMVSPDRPVGGITDDDDNKTEDITDSQLVAMDWMSQFPEESSSTAPNHVTLEADKPDRGQQIEDGSSIMAGFIRSSPRLIRCC